MGTTSDSPASPDQYPSRPQHHAIERLRSEEDDRTRIVPLSDGKPSQDIKPGRLDERTQLSASTAPTLADGAVPAGRHDAGGGRQNSGHDLKTLKRSHTAGVASHTTTSSAASRDTSQNAVTEDPAIKSAAGGNEKPPMKTRMIAGSKRFVGHMKHALTHSWVNVLLIFVPVGIIVEAIGVDPSVVFAMNAVAIVPLAGLLAFATENVAQRLGDTLGALLNVSFGNAVELIIFIIALVKKEIGIVQASLLGSILANLLLILGMAFLLGGLRYREQIYNSTVTQMSACLLSLSVMSLLLPTAFHASFNDVDGGSDLANRQVLKVSRGTCVVLLLVYVLYLLFQLKSHAYMYESTPQAIIDEESHPGVLADIMNSSSSDSSSSSDTSDSDTSASIATAGKRKIKKVFKHRRRRRSSVSTASTADSYMRSALSTASTEGHPSHGDVEAASGSRRGSHGGVALSMIPSIRTDAANGEEDNTNRDPRVRDFVSENTSNAVECNKTTKSSKHKRSKKDKKRAHRQISEQDAPIAERGTTTQDPENIDVVSPSPQPFRTPRVGFSSDSQADNSQSADSAPGKPSFSRQISARTGFRPVLPKMLSNNVFVTPAPIASPQTRPTSLGRSVSDGNDLRRTSSLPDRLNKDASRSTSRPVAARTEPLPPYQHQRPLARSNMAVDGPDSGEDSDDKPAVMSRTASVVLLLCTTALVAVCAEFMVDAIPEMLESSNVINEAFIGLIILPIVGNAAEHVTAVIVATKNKMDLAIGVAVGSSIQIALFVTPVVVLLGWILDTDMSLYFNLFETISLFVTAFVVNFLVLDGRSNYLEGSLLIAAYVIIALGAFFYPDARHQSQVGSGGGAADGMR